MAELAVHQGGWSIGAGGLPGRLGIRALRLDSTSTGSLAGRARSAMKSAAHHLDGQLAASPPGHGLADGPVFRGAFLARWVEAAIGVGCYVMSGEQSNFGWRSAHSSSPRSTWTRRSGLRLEPSFQA